MISPDNVPCAVSPKKRIGILPCSGACNVGMLTARAVVELVDRYDNINFVCALGIPLGIPGIINNAKKSDAYIALNGCDVKCASKALESIGVSVDAEVIVTKGLGIQKTKDLRSNEGLPELIAKGQELIDALSS